MPTTVLPSAAPRSPPSLSLLPQSAVQPGPHLLPGAPTSYRLSLGLPNPFLSLCPFLRTLRLLIRSLLSLPD